MTIPIQVVAHAILQKNKAEGRTSTALQILKFAYLAHGWHLAFWGKPLFSDPIEAWTYGPVIPFLYSKVRNLGGNPIDTELFSDEVKDSKLSDNQQHVINEVIQVYGKYDGIQLSTLTHKEGTPWSDTPKGDVISNELIKKHFKEILTDNKEGA